MVRADKLQNALHALNTALVLARGRAYEDASSAELAAILDILEYLPRLLAAPEDRTDQFRGQLVGLAETYPGFSLALERFDRTPPVW